MSLLFPTRSEYEARVRAVRSNIASQLGVPIAEVTYDAEACISEDHAPGTWVHRGEPVSEAVQDRAGRMADPEWGGPEGDDDGGFGW